MLFCLIKFIRESTGGAGERTSVLVAFVRACMCVNVLTGDEGSHQSEPEASIPSGWLRGERDAEGHQGPLQRHEDLQHGRRRAQLRRHRQQIQTPPGFQGEGFSLCDEMKGLTPALCNIYYVCLVINF